METLIINSNSTKDISLLINYAKKKGIDVTLSPRVNLKPSRRELILAEARILDQSVKLNNISLDEIVEECNIVRQERYENRRKSSV